MFCRNARWKQQNIKIQPWEKSMKAPCMVYADSECLLEKMHSCQNNPGKSYTEKKNMRTPFSYSLFTNCSFDSTNR